MSISFFNFIGFFMIFPSLTEVFFTFLFIIGCLCLCYRANTRNHLEWGKKYSNIEKCLALLSMAMVFPLLPLIVFLAELPGEFERLEYFVFYVWFPNTPITIVLAFLIHPGIKRMAYIFSIPKGQLLVDR